MRITVKLFASLSSHLPADAMRNIASLEVAGEATPGMVMAQLAVPPAQCHLVLVNGEFIPPGEREFHRLKEGDALAIWPPVAGG